MLKLSFDMELTRMLPLRGKFQSCILQSTTPHLKVNEKSQIRKGYRG